MPWFYSTKSRYYQKDQTKKNSKDKSVMVIRYRGTPPSLEVAKGSAHTHVFMSPFLLVKKVLVMMDNRTSSIGDPPICG